MKMSAGVILSLAVGNAVVLTACGDTTASTPDAASFDAGRS